MLNQPDRLLPKNLGLDINKNLAATYFDMSGTDTPALRFAEPFEHERMPRVAKNLNPDYLKINGWPMRGVIREDNGARVFWHQNRRARRAA